MAVLYGSYAHGTPHSRSDLDLAVYMTPPNEKEELEITDAILMSSDLEIAILRLDDDDESPFVVQEAIKGVHLVEPDMNIYYLVADRALHDCELIRSRRGAAGG